MNKQLNKLIQQYPGDKVRLQVAFLETTKDPYYWSVHLQEFLKFIKWLASRPTCGKEQRKFLDEVEKKAEWVKDSEISDIDNQWVDLSYLKIKGEFEDAILHPGDYIADLQKVINGE